MSAGFATPAAATGVKVPFGKRRGTRPSSISQSFRAGALLLAGAEADADAEIAGAGAASVVATLSLRVFGGVADDVSQPATQTAIRAGSPPRRRTRCG